MEQKEKDRINAVLDNVTAMSEIATGIKDTPVEREVQLKEVLGEISHEDCARMLGELSFALARQIEELMLFSKADHNSDNVKKLAKDYLEKFEKELFDICGHKMSEEERKIYSDMYIGVISISDGADLLAELAKKEIRA